MDSARVKAAMELLGRVFTPTAPVHEADLFSGRQEQLDQVLDAANQVGQHVIVYGERGVGKTSLANILATRLESEDEQTSVVSPRVNCAIDDTYDSLWRRICREIRVDCTQRAIGFGPPARRAVLSAVDELPQPPASVAPGDVLHVAKTVGARAHLLIIIDEFDRVTAARVRGLMADTLKMLSDHRTPVTLVLVGVADTVSQLISDHQSIERALVQVRMPRMSLSELEKVVTSGFARLEMAMDEGIARQIVLLSHGLPHYTHNLALLSARHALSENRLEIEPADLHVAIVRAVGSAQESRRETYQRATSAPNPERVFQKLLVACTLAESDELGFFSAADVRAAIAELPEGPTGVRCAQLLNSLSEPRRGAVLEKSGSSGRYRYRFRHAMMKPYVALRGVQERLINDSYFNVRRRRDH